MSDENESAMTPADGRGSDEQSREERSPGPQQTVVDHLYEPTCSCGVCDAFRTNAGRSPMTKNSDPSRRT